LLVVVLVVEVEIVVVVVQAQEAHWRHQVLLWQVKPTL
jgi:hypothetical protein